jgi:hypothetical protein
MPRQQVLAPAMLDAEAQLAQAPVEVPADTAATDFERAGVWPWMSFFRLKQLATAGPMCQYLRCMCRKYSRPPPAAGRRAAAVPHLWNNALYPGLPGFGAAQPQRLYGRPAPLLLLF